ncbi:centromere protein N [Protopterus annectens]|uniref:centromere protein N n=1 Tax=Protopterus annectens TaxID=7888 RepID=UPI001CFB5785|nr:centromere protein N [Protopterus annectens]
MDPTALQLVKGLILRMSTDKIPKLLNTWGVLSESQLKKISFEKSKETVAQQISNLCEERRITIEDAAQLDIIFSFVHSEKKNWDVYQMTKQQGGEVDISDVKDFKWQFKEHLQKLCINRVMVTFRECGDALWIRIAWGTHYSKPNQRKATYAVYHSQTPYVFISSLPRKHQPFLCQTYQAYHPKSVREKNAAPVEDPRIGRENEEGRERVRKMVLERLGEGPLPKLEFAQYKLETAFVDESGRGILADRTDVPFQCVVKFTSPNLLEAIKSTVLLEISDVPPSTLLTSITQKSRNYFRVTGRKGPLPSTSGF